MVWRGIDMMQLQRADKLARNPHGQGIYASSPRGA